MDHRKFYLKVPTIFGTRKSCLYQLRIETRRLNHRVIYPRDGSGMANSDDHCHAPLGAV